ncbi:MAG: restriction endonuclease subunit S, partial [Ruminococcaceae bacterium]|nr:restriction endonuclease subunit S [Oscillospiraceae bacterium]
LALFPDSTVFVSINGTLGKTAFYNGEPVILGKSACYVNVNERLNKFFLRYFFTSKEFIDYANSMATGSTIKNLGLKAMRNLILNLPSVSEQVEIVQILDRIMDAEQQAKSAAEQVISQIDTMKKAILARAFRGELGTNDPTEESAEGILSVK